MKKTINHRHMVLKLFVLVSLLLVTSLLLSSCQKQGNTNAVAQSGGGKQESSNKKQDKSKPVVYIDGKKQEVVIGETIVLPVLEKEGYVFAGWIEKNTNTYVSEELVIESGNEKLEPVWEPESLFSMKSDGEISLVGTPNVEVLVIPSSFWGVQTKKIGDFTRCRGVKKVVVPEGVVEIKRDAFSNCSSLEEVILPSTLKNIILGAFHKCNNIKKLRIPDSVELVSQYAFSGWNLSQTIYCSASFAWNTYGSRGYYEKCDARFVVDHFADVVNQFYDYPNVTVLDEAWGQISNLKEIGQYAFSCRLAKEKLTGEIVFTRIESIGRYAFEGCSGITYVKLPSSLKEIGDCPFCGISPSATIEIEYGGYKNANTSSSDYESSARLCDRDTNVIISWAPDVSEIGRYAFANIGSGTLTIPEGVVEINTGAFSNSGFERIIIPSTVQTIAEYAFINYSDAKDFLVLEIRGSNEWTYPERNFWGPTGNTLTTTIGPIVAYSDIWWAVHSHSLTRKNQ